MQQLSNKQIKKHQTNIKSAVGAFGMTLIMTLVDLVKALLGHNFHFYFCNFVPEVLLKSASFTSAWLFRPSTSMIAPIPQLSCSKDGS